MSAPLWLTVAGFVWLAWAIRTNKQTLTAKRADQQMAWVAEGDPRGTYGEGYQEESWLTD